MPSQHSFKHDIAPDVLHVERDEFGGGETGHWMPNVSRVKPSGSRKNASI
jgi:hypothetical protein